METNFSDMIQKLLILVLGMGGAYSLGQNMQRDPGELYKEMYQENAELAAECEMHTSYIKLLEAKVKELGGATPFVIRPGIDPKLPPPPTGSVRPLGSAGSKDGAMQTPHWKGGKWVVSKRWPNYPFVLWRWSWDGIKDDDVTLNYEGPESKMPDHPPQFIGTTLDPLHPGVSPYNL